jgi:hypothetical protein
MKDLILYYPILLMVRINFMAYEKMYAKVMFS